MSAATLLQTWSPSALYLEYQWGICNVSYTFALATEMDQASDPLSQPELRSAASKEEQADQDFFDFWERAIKEDTELE